MEHVENSQKQRDRNYDVTRDLVFRQKLEGNNGSMRFPAGLTVAIMCLLRLDHICYDMAKYVNPLRVTCYMDEDCVGRLKQLAMHSHPVQMGHQVLERYSAYVCCRWLRQENE